MAQQDSPFSSQDTTTRIFDNSTTAQQAALKVLMDGLKTPKLTADQRQALFATYISTVGSSATFTITGAAGLPTDTKDGAVSGTWTATGGLKGTFSSTTSAGTTASGTLTVTAGTLTTAGSIAGLAFTYNTGAPTTAGTVSGTATVGVGTSALIDGITGYGETGGKTNVISAQLINRQGTIKAKGSTDAGDWTMDLMEIPANAGQILLNAANDDKTANANRVFVQTMNSSDDGVSIQRWYGIGIVTSITNSLQKDQFSTLKVTIGLQDGQVRSSNAVSGI